MPEEYSLYEAKAKLSALVRQVREGRSFTITVHGEAVAELRPAEIAPQTLDDRLRELEGRGLTQPALRKPNDLDALPIGATKAGALKRFLASRD